MSQSLVSPTDSIIPALALNTEESGTGEPPDVMAVTAGTKWTGGGTVAGRTASNAITVGSGSSWSTAGGGEEHAVGTAGGEQAWSGRVLGGAATGPKAMDAEPSLGRTGSGLETVGASLLKILRSID